ncbi:MAG: FtsW/RodA/SpoVE family cell cycle protein [Planctomycetia bacterium]|nr:FtsW/RodA/SpoVE family cell cycle protein [Planctomycetia bacterium]
MIDRQYIARFPWLLFGFSLGLVGVGLAGIYASTAGQFGASPSAGFFSGYCGKQVVWFIVAMVVFCAVLVPHYLKVGRYSYVLFLGGLALLVALAALKATRTEIPGVVQPIRGAWSWIRMPGVPAQFQPSELVKIAFIMSLAWYLRWRKNYRRFSGLFWPFVLTVIPTALILKQPDLGTAMLLMPVLFAMLFAAGAKVRHLLIIIAMGMAVVPIFYLKMEKYQRQRIDAWLLASSAEQFAMASARARDHDQPLSTEQKETLARGAGRSPGHLLWRLLNVDTWQEHPGDYKTFARTFAILRAGPAYHLIQAKTAVGSGGLTGRGWLKGTQTRYALLGEAHTDFIFAVIAEQWGLVGAAGVLLLYAGLFLFGLDIGLSTTEPFGKLLSVGVVALIATQSLVSIAMTMGLLPVTGITLPFMSYGGSSLVSSFLALGLLCNVATRRLYLIAPHPFEWRSE